VQMTGTGGIKGAGGGNGIVRNLMNRSKIAFVKANNFTVF